MAGRVTRTGTYLTETGVESGTISYTTSLLDHLQEQGYEPQEDPEDCYDLTVSGIGTVRIYLSAHRSTYVFLLDQHMVNEWSVNLSLGTPDAAVIAVLEAAERELAAKRGGPVTPAQAQDIQDIPREQIQELIGAIHREGEGGWHDADVVGELVTQFLDARGFDL